MLRDFLDVQFMYVGHICGVCCWLRLFFFYATLNNTSMATFSVSVNEIFVFVVFSDTFLQCVSLRGFQMAAIFVVCVVAVALKFC